MVAALFCLFLCATMLISTVQGKSQNPFHSPELARLKEQLASRPKDEELKKQIRLLDLELRQRYFRRLSLNQTGAWLALGAAAIFLLASKRGFAFQARLPLPKSKSGLPTAEESARTAAWSRRAVIVTGALVLLAALPSAFIAAPRLPSVADDLDRVLGKASTNLSLGDFASAAELRQNWPRFLGPEGSGLAADTNAPVAWDTGTGTGVAWKTAVPLPGFNSPIIWRERVFVSGASAEERRVFCYSSQKGELVWERPVQASHGAPPGEFELPEETGYAPSTMATDGRRVYAIFANGDLVAFTLEGQQLWLKHLGIPKNAYGHATSLATWQSQLIVQLDQGESEDNLSKIYAFDGATGRTLWQRNRPAAASWATPLVIQSADKPQIITLAVPWVMAYSALDGSELWRVEGLNNEITPSPIHAGGLILAVSPNEKLLAIRPDGTGDVTQSHVAWFVEDNIPDIASPAANGTFVFTLSTSGVLTCYGVADGKKHWEQDLELECQASPVIADNRLYVISTKGLAIMIEVAPSYREIGRSDFHEKIFASPAIVGGRLIVRGVEHLYCIAGTDQLVKRD